MGDSLITEGFQLRSEAAALEAEIARFQSQDPICTEELQQAVVHCHELRQLKDVLDEACLAAPQCGGAMGARDTLLRTELSASGDVVSIHLATPRTSGDELSVSARGHEKSSCHGTPATQEDERARLLAVLERQDRQLLLLQQAAQRLSGEGYVAGPDPPDDVDRAVRAAFTELGLSIAPPLARLPGRGSSESSAKHATFLFETTTCEARVDPEADTGGPDGAGAHFRLLSGDTPGQPGCSGGAVGGGGWLTAAQLAEAVGWVPQESAGNGRSRRRAPLR